MTMSMLAVARQTNEIPSFGEPDNLIVSTPFLSSIISQCFSHLTWACVPLDSGLKVVTTPKQQTFHTSRYVHVLSTYIEYSSHMVLIYLISQSIITHKMFSLVIETKMYCRLFSKFYSNKWVVYNFGKIKHSLLKIWSAKNSSTLLSFDYFR